MSDLEHPNLDNPAEAMPEPAQLAAVIADELLSTSLLAATAPVLAAPAMNTAMWKNPATQANVKTLAERGVTFVGPESGVLACGDADVGRMSEPE